MWSDKELAARLERLRFMGSDSQDIEVKECVGGLSESMPETLSAFANESGGAIILGVSERDGFAPATGFKAKPMAEALAQACTDKLQPPIRPDIGILKYRGAPVVVALIDEMAPIEKPCFVKARGRYAGSFIRVGDGDRRLTAYEIDRLIEERQQPTHDRQLVMEAGVSDLLPQVVAGILEQQRQWHPHVFAGLSDEQAMQSLGILGPGDQGRHHPTLAGLLVAGRYPQQFFPRLTVACTAYPTDRKATPSGIKFIDSFTAAGPITDVLDGCIAFVRRNMKVGAVLVDGVRRDVPQYPMGAVREGIVNAVMHRDYSALGLGAYTQLNMYPDRLEIVNPGGLYGNVTVASLGEVWATATRNQTLARLLETTPYRDTTVAENRGTGYQLITQLLHDNGNGAPQVRDSLAAFILTFNAAAAGGHKKTDAASIGQNNDQPITPLSNSVRPSTMPASGESTPLSSETAIDRAKRIIAALPPNELSPLEQATLQFIAERGTARTPELVEHLQQPRSTITYHLNRLLSRGLIARTAPARSPRQAYCLA